MMNIFKFGLILLTATGLGFGVEEVISTDVEEKVYLSEEDNDDFNVGFCHNNDTYFLEHMLEGLTEEEQIIVQTKIDELLIKYDVTIDQLNNDFDVRYDFMIEFVEFLAESELDYYYHNNHHDDYDDEDSGNHMGMHR